MTDRDALDERLRAVERALTDDDRAPVDLSDAAALDDRVDDLARRTTAVEEQVAELEAAVQALRGYVGNVRAVNDDVERRADAALAKVESLERAAEENRSHEAGGRRSGETSDSAPSDPADPLSGPARSGGTGRGPSAAGGDGRSGSPGSDGSSLSGGAASSADGGPPPAAGTASRTGGATSADHGRARESTRAEQGRDERGLLARIAEVL